MVTTIQASYTTTDQHSCITLHTYISWENFIPKRDEIVQDLLKEHVECLIAPDPLDAGTVKCLNLWINIKNNM